MSLGIDLKKDSDPEKRYNLWNLERKELEKDREKEWEGSRTSCVMRGMCTFYHFPV